MVIEIFFQQQILLSGLFALLCLRLRLTWRGYGRLRMLGNGGMSATLSFLCSAKKVEE